MNAGWIMRGALLLVVGLWSGAALAFTPDKSAEQSVIEGVREVLAVVEKYSEDESSGGRQAYLGEVAEVLEPMIGYTVIVSRVMGDTLEQASREQKIRFLDVFKRSMVRTYAGGLYNFGSFEVNLLPSQDDKKDTVRNTRVYLEVVSPNGQRYPMVQSVYYSQADGRWKMQNVIVNGINLGVTFQKQFEQIYRENNGDLDATINEWEDNTRESFDTTEFK